MSNIINFPGPKSACGSCGHLLAPPLSRRSKLEFNTFILPCKTCGVDIMPLGTPKPVGKGLCQCCMSKPSTVRVEVGPNLFEPWCNDCLEASEAMMRSLGMGGPVV
ncbi:MAG: hypothetical protein DDT25_00025 [Chloroflexi bacterium]|nr:hypothetical protein [Chloroflexota bacterium]